MESIKQKDMTIHNIDTNNSRKSDDELWLDMDALGWKSSVFALEIQKPWVDLLRNGSKRIEIRAYPLPPALLNQKIYILESSPSSSSTCSSSLGNCIQLHYGNDNSESPPPPTIVGWCIFSSVKVYNNLQDFLQDEPFHKIPASSPFGWTFENNNNTPGGGSVVLHGWMIDQVGFFDAHSNDDIPQTIQTATTLQRRMRSLFQILQ